MIHTVSESKITTNENVSGHKIAGVSSSDLSKLSVMLTRKINSDPVAYCIREVISNAVDATVRAGKNLEEHPIQVWIKNQNFIVKDFGIGIDTNHFENVVMPLGKSDKTNTNAEIGGFGLGFRSPLSVSDLFTVESNCEGVKRVWTVYIDEDLVKYSLDLEEITNECNGTTISVPVNSTREFSQKIEDIVYCQKGVVLNGEEFENFNNSTLIEGKYFFYRVNYPCKQNTICIGTVPYYYRDSNGPYVVKFSIDELNPTISRETFETKGKEHLIKKRLNDALAEFMSYSTLDGTSLSQLYILSQIQQCPFKFGAIETHIKHWAIQSYYTKSIYNKTVKDNLSLISVSKKILKGTPTKYSGDIDTYYVGKLSGNLSRFVKEERLSFILLRVPESLTHDFKDVNSLKQTQKYLDFETNLKTQRKTKIQLRAKKSILETINYLRYTKIGAGATLDTVDFSNIKKAYYSTDVQLLKDTFLSFTRKFSDFYFVYIHQKDVHKFENVKNFIPLSKLMENKEVITQLTKIYCYSQLSKAEINFLEKFKHKGTFNSKRLRHLLKVEPNVSMNAFSIDVATDYFNRGLLNQDLINNFEKARKTLKYFAEGLQDIDFRWSVTITDFNSFVEKIEVNRLLVQKQKEYIKILKSKYNA